MATYTKVVLSGIADGVGLKVTQTGSPGDTVHTAHATSLDEIWLYAVNTTTTDVKVTIQYGGTTAVDNDIEMTVPAEAGPYLMVPGLIATNSKVIKAYAGSANVVVIYGYVNRIT